MSQEVFLADLFGPTETIQQLQQAVRMSVEANSRLRFCRVGLSSPTQESLKALRTAAQVLIGVTERETLRSRGESPERYASTSRFYLDVSLREAEGAYASSLANIRTFLGYADSLTSDIGDMSLTAVVTEGEYRHDFGYGPYAYSPGAYVVSGGVVYLPSPVREVIGTQTLSASDRLTGVLSVESDLGVEAFTVMNKTLDEIVLILESDRFTASIRDRRLVLSAAESVRCLKVQQTQLAKMIGLPKSQLQTARGYVSAERVAERLGASVERVRAYSGDVGVVGGKVVSPTILQRSIIIASSGDAYVVENGQLYDYANLQPVSSITRLSGSVVYSERVSVNLSAPMTESGISVGVSSRSKFVMLNTAVEAGDRVGDALVVSITADGRVELDREVDEGDYAVQVVGQAELVRLLDALRGIGDEPDIAAIDRALSRSKEYGLVRGLARYASVWRAIRASHAERGFDRAADLLAEARLDEYYACTPTTAAYGSWVSDSVQEINKAVYLS